MGLRFWVSTKTEPIFPIRVQWQFLNQAVTIDGIKCWFVHDEYGHDCSLHECAGYHVDEDGNEELKRLYRDNPKLLLLRLGFVKDDAIDQRFLKAWERPLPYWDTQRTLAIAYIEAKREYILALNTAGITDVKHTKDMENVMSDEKYPPWYYYKYCGDERRLQRIPGEMTIL